MFGHSYYINSKIILYCLLTIALILRIVTSNSHNNNFNHIWDFLTCKLKHMLHVVKKAPSRWRTVKAETCRNIN